MGNAKAIGIALGAAAAVGTVGLAVAASRRKRDPAEPRDHSLGALAIDPAGRAATTQAIAEETLDNLHASSLAAAASMGTLGMSQAAIVGASLSTHGHGQSQAQDSASANSRPLQLAAVYPLPQLANGRKPGITSHHKARNPSRPTHDGADLFYPTMPGDPE